MTATDPRPARTAVGPRAGAVLASALYGSAFVAAVGGTALVLGYPPPRDGLEAALGLVPAAIGLAAACGLAAHALRSQRRLPAALIGVTGAAALAAELVWPPRQVVVAGERYTDGTPWLALLVATWPVLLLGVVIVWAAQARLGREGDRPRWGRALLLSLGLGAGAAAAVATALLPAEPPVWLLVWGLPGYGFAYALAGLLLARPGRVLPVLVLLAGTAVAAVDTLTVIPGTPAQIALQMWPAYLAAALLAGLLEWPVVAVARRAQRARGAGPSSVGGAEETGEGPAGGNKGR
ncbi:hypothetical protein [Nocardiopsis baichengensis]|uniref:hypothetical protein n=1 Tax=Nocardiopsis baichengensis TaxID=280240 RepID=UPI00037005FE|nr:hypothetical protein [Nocardiopsis baichengensis]